MNASDRPTATQLDKLDTLIAIAQRARIAAEHGLLFADRRGLALVNAMHDLVEVDALYDFAADIAREIEPINDCVCGASEWVEAAE